MLKTKPNEIEILNHPQAPCEAPETAEGLRRGLWQAWLRSLLLFCCASVYVELCLHLCVYRSLDRRTVYLVLFGLLGGTVCTLLTTHLPKIARQIVGALLVAVQVLFAEVQLVYHAIFGNFMPISQVSMGGNVITNFDSQILYSIGKNIVPILLLLVPLIVMILCLALRRIKVLKVRLGWRQALATLGILLTLLLATMGIMYAGRGKSFSVYKTFTNVNTSTDSSYKSVGMLATTVQELRYMVFGSSGSVIITPSPLGTDTRRLYSSNSYNVIERIDFAKLAESTDDAMRKTTDEYLAQVTPTRKNNYTGLLEGYNLITICAESFCPWFISEELTPPCTSCPTRALSSIITTARSNPLPPMVSTPCVWGFIRICPALRLIPASTWRAPTICPSAWAMRCEKKDIKPGAITTISEISTTGISPTPTWAIPSRRRTPGWI